MPDLAAFEQELLARLTDPVNTFYDALSASAEPQTGITGFVQPLVARLIVNRAQAALRRDLRAVFELAYQVAGNLGNGGAALDNMQHQAVLARLAEAERYLDGFMADLPTMSRAQALARIAKYVPPILTTASVIAVSDLPALPIMPQSGELDCVKSAHGLPVCRCRLDVKRVGPSDWDVTWLLDPAGVEHCRSCLRLSKTWNPLKIRNGRILPEARAA